MNELITLMKLLIPQNTSCTPIILIYLVGVLAILKVFKQARSSDSGACIANIGWFSIATIIVIASLIGFGKM